MRKIIMMFVISCFLSNSALASEFASIYFLDASVMEKNQKINQNW